MNYQIKLSSAIAFIFFAISNSWGQEIYPNKPINLIAPYSAGGDSDLAARAYAAYAQVSLGQAIVVLNKPSCSPGWIHIVTRKARVPIDSACSSSRKY